MTTNSEQLLMIAHQVVELVETKKLAPVVLIDGRAGSGKTTLATTLQNELFQLLEQAPKLVHMDDLYPGWEGLLEGSQYLLQRILKPLAKSEIASWQIYDWESGIRGGSDQITDPGNGWREFSGGTPLIIEGCGSLSKESKLLADIAIWVQTPETLRRKRWLGREGNSDFFSIWSAQEEQFYEFNNSQSLADFVIAGD